MLTEKWFCLTTVSSNDTREVDIDHISVELALVSTDTRITILSNDMDLCREYVRYVCLVVVCS